MPAPERTILVGSLLPFSLSVIQHLHNALMHLAHKILGIQDCIEWFCLEQVPPVHFLHILTHSRQLYNCALRNLVQMHHCCWLQHDILLLAEGGGGGAIICHACSIPVYVACMI